VNLTPLLLGRKVWRTWSHITHPTEAVTHFERQQQRAWGRDDFRAMVEAKTKRFAGVRPAHRPTKADN